MEEFTKNETFQDGYRIISVDIQLLFICVPLERKKKEIIEDTENRRHRNTARRN